MMNTSRWSKESLLAQKKVWVQLVLGAITLQAVYALTASNEFLLLAIGFTYLAGFLPWSFNFHDDSFSARIYGHEWFRPVTAIAGVIGLIVGSVYSDHVWARALPVLFYIFLMTPARSKR